MGKNVEASRYKKGTNIMIHIPQAKIHKPSHD